MALKPKWEDSDHEACISMIDASKASIQALRSHALKAHDLASNCMYKFSIAQCWIARMDIQTVIEVWNSAIVDRIPRSFTLMLLFWNTITTSMKTFQSSYASHLIHAGLQDPECWSSEAIEHSTCAFADIMTWRALVGLHTWSAPVRGYPAWHPYVSTSLNITLHLVESEHLYTFKANLGHASGVLQLP